MATNAIVDEALSSPEKPDEAGPSTSFSDACELLICLLIKKKNIAIKLNYLCS